MENILALGTSASELALQFSNFEQYENIITIYDHEIKSKSIENYETVNLKHIFKKISILKNCGNLLFIVYGENLITAASLRILEKLKNNNISILYRKPKLKELSNNLLKSERLFYNVFQEYTRSGVFKDLFIFNLQDIEDSFEDLNLLNYNSKISEAICFSIHNYNFFENQIPIKENYVEKLETSRINTLGIFNLESSEELWYFPLDNIDYLRYHIILSKTKLENDSTLLKKINSFADLRTKKFGENIVKYLVHQSDNDTNYGIMLAGSSAIQK